MLLPVADDCLWVSRRGCSGVEFGARDTVQDADGNQLWKKRVTAFASARLISNAPAGRYFIPFIYVEDLYSKCRHKPNNDCNNHDA